MPDDEELQRRLGILKEYLAEGKIKFAPHLFEEAQKSFLAVRYAPDGSVDISTVDSRVRSMALAVTGMKDREDMKNAIPLREAQDTYFTFLDNNFGHLYREMVENNSDPNKISLAISRNDEAVDELASIIPDFIGTLKEFWEHSAEPVAAHLQDSNTLKAVFGGDLFPSYAKNIASTCGLYTDTIVLTDPYHAVTRVI